MGFKINRIKADLGSYPHYMLLGIRKIGKTTFIRDLIKEKYGDATKGLLISCGAENGYHALDDLQVEEAKVFNQDYDEETDSRGFIQIVDDIVENNKDYGIKLVAIDTLDCLYDIAAQEAIRLSRKETGKPCKSINDAFGGYGRGLDRVIALIQEQITRLEDAGIAVFILSHVKEKTRTDMVTGEEYQVWTNNLMDKVYGAIADTAQMVMMAVFDREIKDKKVTGENRVLYLRATASLDAGSRFHGLPEKVPFTPKAFVEAFEEGVKNSATMKPMTDADMAVRQKEEVAQQEKAAEIARRKDAEKRAAAQAEEDEPHRAEWISAIQDRFGNASADVKAQIKAIRDEVGLKFSDPEFPIDALKRVYSLI